MPRARRSRAAREGRERAAQAAHSSLESIRAEIQDKAARRTHARSRQADPCTADEGTNEAYSLTVDLQGREHFATEGLFHELRVAESRQVSR